VTRDAMPTLDGRAARDAAGGCAWCDTPVTLCVLAACRSRRPDGEGQGPAKRVKLEAPAANGHAPHAGPDPQVAPLQLPRQQAAQPLQPAPLVKRHLKLDTHVAAVRFDAVAAIFLLLSRGPLSPLFGRPAAVHVWRWIGSFSASTAEKPSYSMSCSACSKPDEGAHTWEVSPSLGCSLQQETPPPGELAQTQFVLGVLLGKDDPALLDAYLQTLDPGLLADVVIANMAQLPPEPPPADGGHSGSGGLAGLMQARSSCTLEGPLTTRQLPRLYREVYPIQNGRRA
jgi:hypothetical protein